MPVTGDAVATGSSPGLAIAGGEGIHARDRGRRTERSGSSASIAIAGVKASAPVTGDAVRTDS
jgi:hypothetical protein